MKRALRCREFPQNREARVFPGVLDLYDHGVIGIRLAVAGNAFRQEEASALHAGQ